MQRHLALLRYRRMSSPIKYLLQQNIFFCVIIRKQECRLRRGKIWSSCPKISCERTTNKGRDGEILNVISRMMSRTECTERSSQCSMETSNCRTTTARRQRKKWRDTVENDLKVVPKGRGYQDRV